MPALPIQQIQARGLVPETSAEIGSGGVYAALGKDGAPSSRLGPTF